MVDSAATYRRLRAGGLLGRIVSWSSMVAPLVAWIVWELVARANRVELPMMVVAGMALCWMPGLVLVIRSVRFPEATIVGPTTTIVVTYLLTFCVGVPSTWYFHPVQSYFFVYDRALPYFAAFLGVKCAIRLVALFLIRLPRPAPVPDLSRVPYWILIAPPVLLLGIVGIRIAVGAFFHGASGDFQFESPLFGPLMMSMMIVIMLISSGGAEILRRQGQGIPGATGWSLAFLALGALHLGLATIRGGRTFILLLAMILGIAVVLGLRRARTTYLAGGLVLVVGLSVFAGDFRRELHHEAGDKGTADLEDISYAAEAGLRAMSRAENPFVQTLTRVDDFRAFAGVYNFYSGPLLEGETLAVILVDPIPRPLWPEKPSHSDLLQITQDIFREGGSNPLTWPGEFYVNFGETGGVLGGIFAGFVWILFDWFFDWRRRDPIALGFGAVSWMPFSLFIVTVGATIGGIYKTVFPAWVAQSVVAKVYGQGRSQRSSGRHQERRRARTTTSSGLSGARNR